MSIIPEFERQLRDAAERRRHAPVCTAAWPPAGASPDRGDGGARRRHRRCICRQSNCRGGLAGPSGLPELRREDPPRRNAPALSASSRSCGRATVGDAAHLHHRRPAGSRPRPQDCTVGVRSDRTGRRRPTRHARPGRRLPQRWAVPRTAGTARSLRKPHPLRAVGRADGRRDHDGKRLPRTRRLPHELGAHQEQMALSSIERQLGVARAERDVRAIRAALEGLATYRKLTPKFNADASCLESDLRHVAYGVAGPNATSVTVTGEGHHQTIALTPSDDGAYLIVRPVSRQQQLHFGLRTEDLALEAQALHRTIHYENGHSCPQESTPSCLAALGIRYGNEPSPPRARTGVTHPTPAPAAPTALSRRAERDPATPNPVTVTPLTGGPTPCSRSPSGRYSTAAATATSSRPTGARCQRAAERATGGDGVAIGGTPIVRGQTITKTSSRHRTACAQATTASTWPTATPKPQLQNYPFATVRFTVAS